MRFENPYYVDPVTQAATALQPAIAAYLQSVPNRKTVSIAVLKAAVPEVDAAPRAVVNAALVAMGISVDFGVPG